MHGVSHTHVRLMNDESIAAKGASTCAAVILVLC
jgi:hypothetical protein